MRSFVAFVFALFLLAGCSKPQQPKYIGYENFRIAKVGLAKNIVAADVKVYNPNTYPLKIKSGNIDVYFNDRFLGNSFINTLVTLQARDTSSIPLRMEASAKDLLSTTARLLINPNVLVKVTGSARVGRGSVFVNVPINYEGTQRIQLLGNDSIKIRSQGGYGN